MNTGVRAFIPPQEELFRAIAQRADGYSRDDVINATANLLLNTLRQNNKTLGDACAELDNLASRMKAKLAEKHYSADGLRQKHNIVFPQLKDILGV